MKIVVFVEINNFVIKLFPCEIILMLKYLIQIFLLLRAYFKKYISSI
jgi:hypothetical protein